MLDRRRELDPERQEERARPRQPAPALQFGTLGWASAVGSQAVARIARQPAEDELAPEEEPEAPAGAAGPEAQAGAEAELGGEAPELEAEEAIPDDLPDELPA